MYDWNKNKNGIQKFQHVLRLVFIKLKYDLGKQKINYEGNMFQPSFHNQLLTAKPIQDQNMQKNIQGGVNVHGLFFSFRFPVLIINRFFRTSK